MPNIDDLKQNASTFVPSLEQGPLSNNEAQELSAIQPSPRPVSMISGKSVDRVKADFSTLPKSKIESAGVEEKVSIENEILKPGGPFSQYVAEKKQEAAKIIAEMDRVEEDKKYDESLDLGPAQNLINQNDDDFEEEPVPTISNIVYTERDIFGKNKEVSQMQEVQPQADYLPSPIINTDAVEVQPQQETEVVEIVREQPTDTNNYSNAEEVIETEVVDEVKPADKVKINTINKTVDRVTRTYMALDDKAVDVDEETEESSEVTTDEESEDQLNILKSLITEKLRPVSKRLNISGFTVATKGTSSNNILAVSEAATSKWVLPTTGIIIRMKEISGNKLEMIRDSLDRQPEPDIHTALRVIYDHIVSPKAPTFEGWLKSVAYADYDHLFMAVYIASFAGSNYIPIDCICKKTYLTDDLNIMDMVNFKDDKAK